MSGDKNIAGFRLAGRAVATKGARRVAVTLLVAALASCGRAFPQAPGGADDFQCGGFQGEDPR